MNKVCVAASIAALCFVSAPAVAASWLVSQGLEIAPLEIEPVKRAAADFSVINWHAVQRHPGPGSSLDDLPFSRKHSAGAIAIRGTLAESVRAAGVPEGAAAELVDALAGSLDLDEDLVAGDQVSLAWRQDYTIEDKPFGTPQVLWAELRSAVRGTFALHRFKPVRAREERLWLVTGNGAGDVQGAQGTGPDQLRWPIQEINISSGFGLRMNPMIKRAVAARSKHLIGAGGPIDPATLGANLARRYGLTMHQGVDFAAEQGTPIHAAAAGTVTGARWNGGYGNWVEIEHEGERKTVYGHMSAYAKGIKEGVWVERGQLVGYVGSTGRSTGPHLHFEVLEKGVPQNPIVHPLVRRPHLKGGDLARFRKLVLQQRPEVERAASSVVEGPPSL